MITPKNPTERISTEFIAVDIENDLEGNVLHIFTYDGTTHYRHETWAEWCECVRKKAHHHKRWRRIYAHNGGGWDWLSLSLYLMMLPKNKRPTVEGMVNGTKLLQLTIKYHGESKIHLVDSLNLFYTSLDNIAQKLLCRGKTETNGKLPHELLAENPSLYYQYGENDVQLLHECVVSFAELVHSHIGPIGELGITLPSTALRVFRTMLKNPIDIPWETQLRELLRSGYHGGRVEVFRAGNYDNISVYDINSLYPYIMATTKVPTSAVGYWTEKYEKGMCGVYTVRFRQRKDTGYPVLLHNGVGAYHGEGTYFSPELDLLLQVDPQAEIEVITGYVFTETDIVFRDYVEKLYRLRMAHKNGPLDAIAKLFLNSLYGKMGQRGERGSIVLVEDFDELSKMVEDGADMTELDAEMGLYLLTQEVECNFEHVGIAGMITSAARCKLYSHFNAGTVYCDTDSVHTTMPFAKGCLNTELGGFKLEFSGSGVYVGKKLYSLRNGDTEKVRAKGVKVGGKYGCSLRYDDVARLLDGYTKVCKYQSPATPKETFSGKKKPCIIQGPEYQRTRTIKRTA